MWLLAKLAQGTPCIGHSCCSVCTYKKVPPVGCVVVCPANPHLAVCGVKTRSLGGDQTNSALLAMVEIGRKICLGHTTVGDDCRKTDQVLV